MIRHVAGIAEIVEDFERAVSHYQDTLGLEVRREADGYATVRVGGVAHFGIWQRALAAQIVFGDRAATDRIPLGFSIGFEVDCVAEAEQLLRGKGARVVQGTQDEPWGQRTSRFLALSGALCEVSETPNARRVAVAVE